MKEIASSKGRSSKLRKSMNRNKNHNQPAFNLKTKSMKQYEPKMLHLLSFPESSGPVVSSSSDTSSMSSSTSSSSNTSSTAEDKGKDMHSKMKTPNKPQRRDKCKALNKIIDNKEISSNRRDNTRKKKSSSPMRSPKKKKMMNISTSSSKTSKQVRREWAHTIITNPSAILNDTKEISLFDDFTTKMYI